MKKIIAILIVVTAIFIMGLTPTVNADEITFSQIDFYFDGVPILNSEWGSVDFTFTGQEPIMYFNLAINGSWQVQNMPVLSGNGVDAEQTMTYYFDLGTVRGTDVTSLNHDYAFTSYILDTMPGGSIPASVGDDSVELWAGFEGGSMPDLAAAKPLVGGEVDSIKKHTHKDFPNQECGKRECAPAAVSNSLKFLNTKHKLGMKDGKISIAEMKKAVGFVAGWGSPLDTWWGLKKKYMEDNDDYPITTRKITDISKLAAEIDAGQDVEIQESWVKNGKRTGHTTALVGITKLKNGKYVLDIADDRKQGKPGGCDNPRTYTYDPATGNFDELGFISKFEYAVVECPECLEVNKTVWNPATKKWVKSRVAKKCENLKFKCTIHPKCCNLTNIVVKDVLSESLNYTSTQEITVDNETFNVTPTVESGPDNTTNVTWTFPPAFKLKKCQTLTIIFDAHKKLEKCDSNYQIVTGKACNKTWVTVKSNTVNIFDINVDKWVWNPAIPPKGGWTDSLAAKKCDTLKFKCVIHPKCCNLTNIVVKDVLSESLDFMYTENITVDNESIPLVEPTEEQGPDNTTIVTWTFPLDFKLEKCQVMRIKFYAHKDHVCSDWNYQIVEGKACNKTWVTVKSNIVNITCVKEFPAITPLGFLLALLSLFGLGAVAMRKMYKR